MYNLLIPYGSDAHPCPQKSKSSGIFDLLGGHTGTVKAVKFVTGASSEHDEPLYLVSGGDDHTLKLWIISGRNGASRCVQTVQEHTAPINCVATVGISPNQSSAQAIIATGSADATVKLWTLESGKLSIVQSISTTPKFFPLALALSRLDGDGNALILAVAGTRDAVQIMVSPSSPEALDFKLQATLSGHEGWVRSLDFTRERHTPGGDILLASASQDKYIRLWRIHHGATHPLGAALDSKTTVKPFSFGKSPSNKTHRIKTPGDGADYSVTFDSLLLGHDDWIYSARWQPRPYHPNNGIEGEKGGPKLQLLSTSADNSLAVWEADPDSGIWVTTARLGELSREKGATTATGSIGGFWTGLWAPDGRGIVTLGRTGSWRRWELDGASDAWTPALAVSGHTKAVTGIAWSRSGSYLLSTSSDQTTRVHAPWTAASEDGPGEGTWHEVSRPQIHGYDLNCIASLDEHGFVSGADEKLMRVFREPRGVAGLRARLAGPSAGGGAAAADAADASLPDAANMPVLGLSNKAIVAAPDDEDDSNAAAAAGAGAAATLGAADVDAPDPAMVARRSALAFARPPFEDSLSRHTLWAEAEKLYGHGYEISCAAASHDGGLVASACRASSLNHAVVRLFETRRWTELRPPLPAHTLTVARLRFAPPDDRFLLSVGRDRQWAVFERRDDGPGAAYALRQANPKGHTRMILDCAWAPVKPETGRRAFATAGRDKLVKIWAAAEVVAGEGTPAFELVVTVAQEHPVTAVDFLWRSSSQGHLVLAVGSEAGKLSLVFLHAESLEVASIMVMKPE